MYIFVWLNSKIKGKRIIHYLGLITLKSKKEKLTENGLGIKLDDECPLGLFLQDLLQLVDQ